jgi:hypothetical protein
VFELAGASIEDIDDKEKSKKSCFKFIAPRHYIQDTQQKEPVFVIATETSEELNEWFDALRKVIMKYPKVSNNKIVDQTYFQPLTASSVVVPEKAEPIIEDGNINSKLTYKYREES